MGYSNGPVGLSKEDVAGAPAVDGYRNGDTADVPVNDSTGEHAETGQVDSGDTEAGEGRNRPQRDRRLQRRIQDYAVNRVDRVRIGSGFAQGTMECGHDDLNLTPTRPDGLTTDWETWEVHGVWARKAGRQATAASFVFPPMSSTGKWKAAQNG